jgi:hypothetical protein
LTEENKNEQQVERQSVMSFDSLAFGRLVINELAKTRDGRSMLKKYKQSEVREIIEGYKREQNQIKLREISQLLFAKSGQYQRLIRHFSDMALFSHIIAPVKDIKKGNKTKVLKQYVEIAELLKLMSLRHEMQKVLRIAFTEDVFYGYIHKDKKSFYIQAIDSHICKITSVEDGVFNFSIDMNYFLRNEELLNGFSQEVKVKYFQWKSLRDKNSKIYSFVELDAQNTICIKVNEHILETFPPFASSFDSIYDIEGFKQLRKDKEELGNYMILTQELPMRKDSENNNDFMIDLPMMQYFHNMASDTVPENVGVITSPMKIEALKFDKDRADSDGVGKATRDFWEGNGASQLLFSSDTSTSQGLLMSVKTDEEIVFAVITQIERWLNRYLKFQFNDLMFNVDILNVTYFNQADMHKMYLEAGQFGLPVKNRLSAVLELDPIEVIGMSYLENDLLKFHEEWIPLQSSHTMGDQMQTGTDGRPKKDKSKISDETARSQDKPNA